MHYAEANTKDYILYQSIYMAFWKRQSYRDREQRVRGFQGLVRIVRRALTPKATVGGNESALNFDGSACLLYQNSLNYTVKRGSFTLCKYSLNEPDFKKN